MKAPTVLVMRLPHGADLDLPSRASAGSAGFDLRAAIATAVVLEPGRRMLVPTGLALALPPNWEAQVRPRSGLALRYGVTVLNSPGTIDSDYRGEVGVILIHHGESPLTIERGDRIAQLVFARVAEIAWREVESLEDGDSSQTGGRGDGGFGSSGR